VNGPGEIEIYRSEGGAELAVVAATWHLNPKTTFESLQLQFERDPDQAWRNYGSVLKRGQSNALKDPTMAARLANRERVHPWDEATDSFASWFRGVPGYEYFIHIDLAKNHDRAGIALGHRARGSTRVVVDFMAGVAGKNGRDIQIADIRSTYIYGLTDRGFHIKHVSYDQWQSLESVQELTKRGYAVEEMSADKTMAPYDTLYELLRAGNLDYYLYPLFVKEIQALKRYPKKYDHPKGGSKDVSDAVACVCQAIVQDEIDNPYTGDSLMIVNRQARSVLATRNW
jgi:hypothetical protein